MKYSYLLHAEVYLNGLFKIQKKKANFQEIADTFGTFDQQAVNHFILSKHWNYESLMYDVAQSSNTLFQELSVAQDVGTALLVDEVSFRKKGKYSACVERQYLGSLGKVDNGQVAVCLALSKGSIFSPINLKLFMPESWEEDHEKRHRCHIPKEEKHVPKPKMALDMIQEAKNRRIQFDFVNFDSLYGSSYESLLESFAKPPFVKRVKYG